MRNAFTRFFSSGLLSRISIREQALAAGEQAAWVFLALATVLLGLFLNTGARTLVDVGLFAILGVLLWRYRSPVAAVTLLLVAIMRLLMTLAQSLDTGEVEMFFAALSLIAVFTAIRAVEATLKLIGRFAGSGKS